MDEKDNLEVKEKRKFNWKIFSIILLSILGVVLIGFLSLYLYIAISSKKDDYKYYLITNNSISENNYVKYDELPSSLINAILASNDNPNYLKEKTSFINSIFNNNYFNTSIMSVSSKVNDDFKEDSVFIHRVRKACIAKKLEKNYSKETILEYYVNNTYLGNNIYGFENAGQEYFNKSLKELNLNEITLLVAISINPNSYNLNDNVDATHTMQEVILKKMIKYGYITDYEYSSLEEDKNYGEIKIDDLEKIDMSSININTELPSNYYKPEKIETLKSSTKMVPLSENSEYKYTYTNNSFTIFDNAGNKKEYNNVDIIYFVDLSESGVYLFINTDDKIIELDLDAFHNNLLEDWAVEEHAYSNNSYDSIYSIWVRDLTSGAEYMFVGHKDNGKYYDLLSEEEINTGIKYNDFNLITSDRKLKINNTELIVKVVAKDSVIDTINYVIDSNNYLYEYDNNELVLKKLSEKKVKTIYYEKEYSILGYIKFEDDTFYGSDELEYSYIEF